MDTRARARPGPARLLLVVVVIQGSLKQQGLSLAGNGGGTLVLFVP